MTVAELCRRISGGDHKLWGDPDRLWKNRDGEVMEIRVVTMDKQYILFGPTKLTTADRPSNYHDLSAEEQWAADKQMGLLDV